MRLTCPNCGAQYEVPAEAIPPAGREVQCSSCQTTWFEKGAAPEPWEAVPAVQGDPEEDDDLAELGAAPPAGGAPRPRVDPEVSRILREEAERERAARAVEAAMRDVPEIVPRPTPPRRLHARELPEGEAAPMPPIAAPAARAPGRPARAVDREVDPERISSTLRSPVERVAAAAAARPARSTRSVGRSGFARGFVGSLLVLAVLVAVYIARDDITEAYPGSAALLDPYAEAVDDARAWLDGLVGRLIGAA